MSIEFYELAFYLEAFYECSVLSGLLNIWVWIKRIKTCLLIKKFPQFIKNNFFQQVCLCGISKQFTIFTNMTCLKCIISFYINVNTRILSNSIYLFYRLLSTEFLGKRNFKEGKTSDIQFFFSFLDYQKYFAERSYVQGFTEFLF